MRILFVCSGNICRSPLAEAVMRKLVEDIGLSSELILDSAGTGRWHVGEPPDPSAIAVAAERGYLLSGRARMVEAADFARSDLLVAMDRSHQRALHHMSLDLESRSKVRMLLDSEDVPDPYHKPLREFERVLEIVERGCGDLLRELTSVAL